MWPFKKKEVEPIEEKEIVKTDENKETPVEKKKVAKPLESKETGSDTMHMQGRAGITNASKNSVQNVDLKSDPEAVKDIYGGKSPFLESSPQVGDSLRFGKTVLLPSRQPRFGSYSYPFVI